MRRAWPWSVVAALTFAGTGCATVPPADTTVASPDYRQPSTWLCRPGRDDACAVDLTATSVAADGALTPIASPDPNRRATVDCFYVYPTVSLDEGANSDLEVGPEERAVVAAQFARFRSVCRPFAPAYRQMTLTGLRAAALTGAARQGADLAYADVRAAFQDYLAQDNDGRRFVLIGHSQGAQMLKRLVAEEVEGRAAANRMLSAMLIGTNVEVATGRDTGGDFRTTPLCRAAGQTGCVVSYVSFRADRPPPTGGRFARASTPDRTVACTNPADLSGDAAELHAVLPTTGSASGSEQPPWVVGSTAITTRFVRTPGLLSAECLNRDGAHYLAITTHADPGDPRADRIGGDVMAAGVVLPEWGLHLLDMNLALDDLVELVATQARTATDQGPG